MGWKDSTQRFVFENAAQAKTMFENANNFLNQSKAQSKDITKTDEPSPQPVPEFVPAPEPPQTPIIATEEEKALSTIPETPTQTAEIAPAKSEVIAQTEISAPETEAPLRLQVTAPVQVIAPEPEPKAEEIAALPSNPEEEHDAASTLVAVYPIVDLLFDVLIKLHGKVDWNLIENDVKNIEEETKLMDQVMKGAKLDTSLLVEGTKLGNAAETSKDAYKILISINDSFNSLASPNPDSQQMRLQYAAAKDILSLYYLLNDIILASVVEDPTVNEESNQLVTMLNNFAIATTFQISTKAVVDALGKVQIETGSQESIGDCRALFKNQFESFFSDLKSLSNSLTNAFLP